MRENLVQEIRENYNLPEFKDILKDTGIPFLVKDISTWSSVEQFLSMLRVSEIDIIYARTVLVPRLKEIATLANLAKALDALQVEFKKVEIRNWTVAQSFLLKLDPQLLHSVISEAMGVAIFRRRGTLATVKDAAQRLQLPFTGGDFKAWDRATQWLGNLSSKDHECMVKEVLIISIMGQCSGEDLQQVLEYHFDSKIPSASPEAIRKTLRNFDEEELEFLDDQLLDILVDLRMEKEEGEGEDEEEDTEQKRKEIGDSLRLETLKKIIKVAIELPVARLAQVLEMEESVVWKKVFDWADQFGFQVKNDTLLFSGGQKEEFITKLDKEFAIWNKNEKVS